MDTMPMIWQAPERFRSRLSDVSRWLRLNEAEIENALTQRGVLVVRGFQQLTNHAEFETIISGFFPLTLSNRTAYLCVNPVEEANLEPIKLKLRLQYSDILIIDKRFMANNPKKLLREMLLGLMSPQLEF